CLALLLQTPYSLAGRIPTGQRGVRRNRTDDRTSYQPGDPFHEQLPDLDRRRDQLVLVLGEHQRIEFADVHADTNVAWLAFVIKTIGLRGVHGRVVLI